MHMESETKQRRERRTRRKTKLLCKVVDIFKETPNVSTLVLESLKGDNLSFKPGQYIVCFPTANSIRRRSYTISSVPSGKKFSISVKKVGTVSSQLVAMKRGDTLIASLPLGSFYSKSQNTPLVMIAAGISVTPFRSMIFDNIERNPSRKLVLFYSNQTIADIVFKKQFDDLATLHPQFQVHYFITREKTTLPGITNGRMTGKNIMNTISGINDAEFFICGSGDFVHSFRHGLIAEGVLRSTIHTESFPRISLVGTLKRVFTGL